MKHEILFGKVRRNTVEKQQKLTQTQTFTEIISANPYSVLY